MKGLRNIKNPSTKNYWQEEEAKPKDGSFTIAIVIQILSIQNQFKKQQNLERRNTI